MRTMTRSLLASLPVAALLLSPALANAHPTEDEVSAYAVDGGVEVMIVNTHDYAINCESNVDGGPTLTMTVGANDVEWTTHPNVPKGDHTVNWSCPTDANGPTAHGAGSVKVTAEDPDDSWF